MRLRKAFANVSSANIKLSKAQLREIGKSGGFLGRRFRPLLKTGLPLVGSAFKPLTESFLITLGLTTADSAIHKKYLDLAIQH